MSGGRYILDVQGDKSPGDVVLKKATRAQRTGRWTGVEAGLCIQRDIWILAGLALVLRLVYLWLGLNTQPLSEVCLWAHDSRNYVSVAGFWLTGDPAGEQVMLLYGPGYGLILAALQAAFLGSPMWPALCLNILLGCAAPVVVYLTALVLLRKRSVALCAGLFSCISVTSLSVSTSLLSDQPFFTLHSLAVLMFVLGWKQGQARWFVAAGLAAGVATWIRVMGQVWPLVFVFVALLLARVEGGQGKWRRFGRTLWTPAILLLFILGWSAWNYSRHGIFTLTTNGARSAWLYLGARALAMNTPGLDTETARAQLAEDLQRNADPAHAELDMYRLSVRRFGELLQSHPWWVARAYVHNVVENVQESNYDVYQQLPQYKRELDIFTRQARDWGNDWIFWGSAVGLILLVRARQHLAWVVLGTTFAVFTLVTGFSFWQGSRLHYPAEMAWSILLSFSIITVATWIHTRWSQRLSSPT